jgi:hypothetical protein
MVTILLALSTWLLVDSPAASAQSIFANLSGTVTDSSGAAVVGAKVEVMGEATKVGRSEVTNSTGFFSLTELPTGSYSVTVQAKGFEKWIGSGILLQSTDNKDINISLKVGKENMTVEVTADSDQMDITDSGAKEIHISGAELEKMTLVGSNATEVLKMLPGFTMNSNGGTNSAAFTGGVIGINGSIGDSVAGLGAGNMNGLNSSNGGVSLNADGQHVADPGNTANTPVNPNPDMISEITVQTSNFGADNAHGPVVINTVSKAGSADFHGDFRLHVRNSVLNSEDANLKFNEAQAGNGLTPGELKANEHFYYPGFGIGGPIVIPHTNFNKNKTKYQFHDSYEYYGQQTGSTSPDRAFVPTADMLNGDFSALTGWAQTAASSNGWFGTTAISKIPTANTNSAGFNERTGCTISPTGVMNSNCLSSLAAPLLNAMAPRPTTPDGAPNSFGFNYIAQVTASMNSWQNVAHIDVNLTDNTKLYFNWSHQSEGTEQPNGQWVTSGDWTVPLAVGDLSYNKSDLYTVNAVHVFAPTLTVQGRVGYTHLHLPGAPKNPKLATRAGLNFPQKGVFGSVAAPRISNGWSRDNSDIPELGDYQIAYNPDFNSTKTIPSTAEDVTKVIKTHTLKAGFSWERVGQAQDATGTNFGGEYQYSSWAGTQTGNLYADILMGLVDGASYSEQAFPKTFWNYAGTSQFYVQDDWKATKRITVNAGLRFAHFGAAAPDNAFGSAVFNPTTYASDVTAGSTHPGLSWYGLDKSISKAGVTPDLFKYAPRFGASIDVFGTGKTVVRGGWGVYSYPGSIFANGTGTAYGTVSWNCNSGSGCPTWEDVDSHINNGSGGSNPCAAGSNCAPIIPSGGQVQTKPTNYVNGGVSVVDSTDKADPQTTTYSLNVDQKLPGKMLLELAYVGNHSDYGQDGVNLDSVPFGTMNNPSNIETSANGGLATAVPQLTLCAGMDSGNYSATNPLAVLNAQQGDGNCQQKFRPYSAYQGINAYESSFKSQYDGLQVSLNRSAGWALININYSFSKLYSNSKQSGAFKDWGQSEYWGVDGSNRSSVFNAMYVFDLPKLHTGNRLLRGAANGWQLSGFTTIEQGFNLTPGIGGSLGGAALVGSPDVTPFSSFTCNPKSGLVSHQFANGACYAPTTASGSIGNAARAPYIPAPAFWDTDATVVKQISIGERQKVELRAAGYDFLNHALQSFNGSGDQNLTVSGTNLNAQPGCPGPLCNEFGFADYHFGHRVIEFAAKYSF